MSHFKSILYVTVLVVLLKASFPAMSVAAKALQDVIIANTPDNPVPVQGVGTQTVAGNVTVSGTVDVSNLPLTSDGRVLVRNDITGLREARHGDAIISLESAFPRSIDLPPDVVLTDAIVTRANLSTSDSTCDVWLFEVRGGNFGPIHTLRPSGTDPVDEIHLESGIAPTADRFGFFLNSNCRVNVLWSGYTQP
jgi:hypothetical protein